MTSTPSGLVTRLPPTDPAAKSDETALNNRITQAANLVRRMAGKGKQAEAEALLADFRSKPVPQMLFFRSPEPTREGFDHAARDAADQLKNVAPDPSQDLKDEQWHAVVDEIRRRAKSA